MTREYDFPSAPDFGLLNANRNPAARCRCENEIGAKTENRQICPAEGLGRCDPQRDGRDGQKLILEFSYSLAVSCSEQVRPCEKYEKTDNRVFGCHSRILL